MKTILVIGGMAQSGKSTSLKFLNSLGYPTVSTSVLLDKVIENLSFSTGLIVPTEVEERRKLKITVAEQVLVPIFGREIFAYTAARHIFQYKSPVIVVETIGGEEYELLQKGILNEARTNESNLRIYRFNVKKDTELRGVDIRVPLENAYSIMNNGTIQELQNEWIDQLVKLGVIND